MSRQWFQQLLPALKLELSSGFAMMQPNARRLTSRQRNVSIRSGFGWGRRSPDRVGQFAIRERERLAALLRHTGLEQQQLRQAYAPPVSVRCAWPRRVAAVLMRLAVHRIHTARTNRARLAVVELGYRLARTPSQVVYGRVAERHWQAHDRRARALVRGLEPSRHCSRRRQGRFPGRNDHRLQSAGIRVPDGFATTACVIDSNHSVSLP